MRCDRNQFFRQVNRLIVVLSEIMAVRRVVRQLDSEAHCHAGTLYRMSAFHTFFSEWNYAVCLVFRNKLLILM
jgi:hypothetical protein